MPSGFKRMIESFEEMPEDKRRRALDDALKRMREARAESRDPAAAMMGQSREEARERPISPEVRQTIMETGLGTFYRESSAATKAEVMPLLEELQRSMQSGRYSR